MACEEFGGVTPIFRVENVRTSIEYYAGALGFEVQWETPGFACVKRGRTSLFLCEGDQGHAGGWVWIGVSDAEGLHEEFAAKGARIRHRPTNYQWAYEMQVEDPDGNVLRIGSDSKDGEPFGEWMDMRGDRWVPGAEGGWTLVTAG